MNEINILNVEVDKNPYDTESMDARCYDSMDIGNIAHINNVLANTFGSGDFPYMVITDDEYIIPTTEYIYDIHEAVLDDENLTTHVSAEKTELEKLIVELSEGNDSVYHLPHGTRISNFVFVNTNGKYSDLQNKLMENYGANEIGLNLKLEETIEVSLN